MNRRGLQELLWVKRKFVHRFGFLRTRTQRSGTQCNGTRTRWLFELLCLYCFQSLNPFHFNLCILEDGLKRLHEE